MYLVFLSPLAFLGQKQLAINCISICTQESSDWSVNPMLSRYWGSYIRVWKVYPLLQTSEWEAVCLARTDS